MKRSTAFFICFIAIVGVFMASCNNDSEENRAVVTVASINGNAPFFSDVLDQGDTLFFPGTSNAFTQDDFVQEDFVEVIFHNRPYNVFTTTGPGLPLSDFLITRYRVEWRATGAAPAVPPVYDGATSIMVPSNELGIGYIVLVPFEVKNSPLMTPLNYSSVEYLMIADITFWGHEVGAQGREWSFGASLSVNFADPLIVSE